ncbi:response regulator transcription factor [Luteibacter sp. 329MFSha]|uniref:response regulator transcription factor n=1 Tax=Luteibacter sp. 329MFSha TaxID=1798239 RepID=UPI0008B9DE3E|nr:response regulator transcription factor [Luteibacter sp. 329MFSha]SEV89869.1 DNA-binding response regulator, OmpR family, contains REC and winged-helix (wHTH) domain [Luteibacter sp. 329MFSha]
MTQPLPALSVALLEDDEALRERVLAPELKTYGFDVCTAGRPAELDAILASAAVDVVVLDVGLPDEDGFSIVRRLRGTPSLGLVLLTARDENTDRVRGLEDGADAYLAKPVALPVLAATIRSVARRLASGPSTSAASVGADWTFHDGGWVLRSPDGTSVALTAHERCVLELLHERRGLAVERDALIAALSDGSGDFDPHRLEMTIHRLRTKVSRANAGTLPVRAVRARGYVMLPPDAPANGRR